MTLETPTLFDHLDPVANPTPEILPAASDVVAAGTDATDRIVPVLERANLSPAASKEAFTTAMRALVRSRLRGDINFEQFATANLELHFRYGRPGYTHADYERDIAEYRERMRHRPADGRLRPVRWVTVALEAGPASA